MTKESLKFLYAIDQVWIELKSDMSMITGHDVVLSLWKEKMLKFNLVLYQLDSISAYGMILQENSSFPSQNGVVYLKLSYIKPEDLMEPTWIDLLLSRLAISSHLTKDLKENDNQRNLAKPLYQSKQEIDTAVDFVCGLYHIEKVRDWISLFLARFARQGWNKKFSHILFHGTSGMGKSTLVTNLVHALSKSSHYQHVLNVNTLVEKNDPSIVKTEEESSTPIPALVNVLFHDQAALITTSMIQCWIKIATSNVTTLFLIGAVQVEEMDNNAQAKLLQMMKEYPNLVCLLTSDSIYSSPTIAEYSFPFRVLVPLLDYSMREKIIKVNNWSTAQEDQDIGSITCNFTLQQMEELKDCFQDCVWSISNNFDQDILYSFVDCALNVVGGNENKRTLKSLLVTPERKRWDPMVQRAVDYIYRPAAVGKVESSSAQTALPPSTFSGRRAAYFSTKAILYSVEFTTLQPLLESPPFSVGGESWSLEAGNESKAFHIQDLPNRLVSYLTRTKQMSAFFLIDREFCEKRNPKYALLELYEHIIALKGNCAVVIEWESAACIHLRGVSKEYSSNGGTNSSITYSGTGGFPSFSVSRGSSTGTSGNYSMSVNKHYEIKQIEWFDAIKRFLQDISVLAFSNENTTAPFVLEVFRSLDETIMQDLCQLPGIWTGESKRFEGRYHDAVNAARKGYSESNSLMQFQHQKAQKGTKGELNAV